METRKVAKKGTFSLLRCATFAARRQEITQDKGTARWKQMSTGSHLKHETL
jgi:hypothetical protein